MRQWLMTVRDSEPVSYDQDMQFLFCKFKIYLKFPRKICMPCKWTENTLSQYLQINLNSKIAYVCGW